MSEQTSFINGLYLVSTPIGNLGDISDRAVKILKNADIVACEDTRVTSKLFSLLGISAPLTPYHEHNAEKARPALIKRLKTAKPSLWFPMPERLWLTIRATDWCKTASAKTYMSPPFRELPPF